MAAALLGTLLLLSGCVEATTTTSGSDARGHDPWVFRSVLDERPRMITLALHDDLWVAYDAAQAALYKVWREGVVFDGAVYTTAHGPQPTSVGDAYLVSPYAAPWSVIHEGNESRPQVRYKGHRLQEGHATLQYDLILADGTAIGVTETPEYVRNAADRQGLERVFATAGVPEGAEVRLHIHLNSLAEAGSYETDGRFDTTPPAAVDGATRDERAVDGWLTLKANGTTRLTAWLAATPQVAAQAVVDENEGKHPGLVLIEQSDCQACHNAEVQTIGPAYRAIAERYETSDAVIAQLATKIIEGGSGVWGEVMMSPHPDLQPVDARRMMAYILSLDGEAPPADASEADSEEAVPEGYGGLAINVYQYDEPLTAMPEPDADDAPVFSGPVPRLHAVAPDDFGGFTEHFALFAHGTIEIPETTNYVFRLVSDDGAALLIDGDLIIDHGGIHEATPKDGEVYLEAGPHKLAVRYFQAEGDKTLSLQWISHGEDAFTVVPPSVLTFDEADLKEAGPATPPEGTPDGTPGDGRPLDAVHPSFDLETIRPAHFEPKVGGLDVRADGRVVVSTWDPDGSVYLLSNVNQGDPEQIDVQRIASGLLEPLGLTVVEGELYVLQKHELTHLIDHDGDEIIDEYRTVADGWRVSANFHEFAFGLVYQDGYFYATLATAIMPGGASASPQIPDRGKVIKISRADGSVEFVAHGLRTPNGIGVGVDGELFIADNQGDWLPASKIVHVRPGAWYGSRSVDFEGTATLEETLPVVWLPQDEIGNSPSQPALLDVGPYQGQLIHGEVTHGGIKRVFVEQVNGQYQGAVFRFTQGLEAGVNRLVWGPDGKLYIGGIGNPGNWSHLGTNWFGLQRMTYTGTSTFEMLAVRVRSNGLDIEFTEPLQENDGTAATDYLIEQWRYQPTANYGGPKLDLRPLSIASVQVSDDRKRVFLEVAGLQPGHVVYIRLLTPFISEAGHALWTTEAWYTLNQLPQNQPGSSAL